jgi:predicted O-methyltransferase YrrM
MPVFTVGWGGADDRWDEILAEFKGREVSALEIGSFEGRSAIWLLNNILTHEDSSLMCVDTFEGSMEHSDAHKHELYERCVSNLSPYSNVEIVKGSSHAVMRTINKKFDFIYIDGDHRAASVLEDAVLAFRLLKFGGILIFDDYLWQDPRYPRLEDAPKLGIDSFLSAFQGQYVVVSAGYQYTIRKVRE